MAPILTLIAVSLVITGTASAHWVRTPYYIKHKIHSKEWQVRAWKMNLAHSQGAISWLKQYDSTSQSIRAHKYIVRLSKSKLAQLLTPPLPAHYAGWICIHNGEGAWNSQTGNGFYGGLQMTYGWMGLVTNAALLSPLQQMNAAETGYQRSGYSHSWLAGQWPNTYPPCSRYF